MCCFYFTYKKMITDLMCCFYFTYKKMILLAIVLLCCSLHNVHFSFYTFLFTHSVFFSAWVHVRTRPCVRARTHRRFLIKLSHVRTAPVMHIQGTELTRRGRQNLRLNVGFACVCARDIHKRESEFIRNGTCRMKSRDTLEERHMEVDA